MTLDEHDLQAIRRTVAILQDDAVHLDKEHNLSATAMRRHVLKVIGRLKRIHRDATEKHRNDGPDYGDRPTLPSKVEPYTDWPETVEPEPPAATKRTTICVGDVAPLHEIPGSLMHDLNIRPHDMRDY